MPQTQIAIQDRARDALNAWRARAGDALGELVSQSAAIELLVRAVEHGAATGEVPELREFALWLKDLPRRGRPKQEGVRPAEVYERWLDHQRWAEERGAEPRMPEDLFSVEEVKALRQILGETGGAELPPTDPRV